MNTCETCKHWGGQTEDAKHYAIHYPGWNICTRIEEFSAEERPDELAATFSSEWGDIATKATFGCVLHETKC